MGRIGSRRVRVARIVAVLLACSTGALHAQTGVCDPHLPQPANDPNGYRMRGDRCEGLYIREVAGSSSVALVSLTRSSLAYDLKSGNDIVVDWRSPSNQQPVHLRGVGLRRRLYYQMNAERPAGATSYTWKTGVLANLDLKPAELGLVAWVSAPVGAETRDVYLPVSLHQGPSASVGSAYNVTLSPSAELSEVYVTLTPIDSAGHPKSPLLNGRKLGFGYYPAMRPLSFPVSTPREPGIYALEIAAVLKTGEPSTLRLFFYHSGK